MTKVNPIRVGVIGPGKIGRDLCERILRDSCFELVAIISNNASSKGLKYFSNRVDHAIDNGIHGLVPEVMKKIDGFFDCSTAESATLNWDYLKNLQKWVIDLTPSNIGFSFTPFINDQRYKKFKDNLSALNFSMVSCGGQSSAPIIFSICDHLDLVNEVEVSSSIAAESAGMATRNNIDNYIHTTENMIYDLVTVKSVKVILVLNPSTPPVSMRTTVTVNGKGGDPIKIKSSIENTVDHLKKFVPGIELIYYHFNSRLSTYTVSVLINGQGIYLPEFAGNLDIINIAAVETAKKIAYQQGS